MNFMSHENSIINLKNGFNLLIGRNGSGKSAFIEALEFLVSGKKDRYPRWGDYIRNGTDQAFVIIIIENSSQYEIKRKITRKATKDYSYYYVNGKKSSLSDIRDLFISFGFNILNPLIAIKQSQINTLISTFSPQSLLYFIESSSTIFQDKVKVIKASENLALINNKLKELDGKKRQLSWRFDSLKEEKNKLEKYDELIAKIKQYEVYYNYYQLKNIKISLSLSNSLKKSNELKIEKINKVLNKLESDIDVVNIEKDNQAKLVDSYNIELREYEKQSNTLEGRISIILEQIRKKIRSLKISFQINNDLEFDESIESLLKQISDLEEEKEDLIKLKTQFNISEETLNNFKNFEWKYEQLSSNIDEKNKDIIHNIKNLHKLDEQIVNNRLNSVVNIIESKIHKPDVKNFGSDDFKFFNQYYKEQIKIYQENKFKIENDLTQLNDELNKLENKSNLLKSKNEKLLLPNVVKNIDDIIKNEKIDAIGPLFKFIKFTDSKYEKIAKFMIADPIWNSFIVKNRKDYNYLNKLKNDSADLLIILYKNHLTLPSKNEEFLELKRLIDGIQTEAEIKGFLYELIGDVYVSENQEEAELLRKINKKIISLSGIYTQISNNYETQMIKSKSMFIFSTDNLQELILTINQNIIQKKEEIEILNDNRVKISNKLRFFESQLKIVEIIQYCWNEKQELIIEFESLKNEINVLSPKIKQFSEIKNSLEIIENKLGEYNIKRENLIEIRDLLNNKKEEEKKIIEIKEFLNSISSQIDLEKDKLSTIQSSIVKNKSLREKKNLDFLEANKVQKQLELKIRMLNQEIGEFPDVQQKTTPKISESNLVENLKMLRNEKALLGTIDPNIRKKFNKEESNLKKFNQLISREQRNSKALEKRISVFIGEWKRILTEITQNMEKNAKKILTQKNLDIKLSFRPLGQGISAFDKSLVDLEIVNKNNVITPATSMSGGEKGLIAMALVLGIQDALPEGGIRILDEFDESLDKTNTIFVRDQILSKSNTTQYLVLTPGKFHELALGANIIRIDLINNKTRIIDGWPLITVSN